MLIKYRQAVVPRVQVIILASLYFYTYRLGGGGGGGGGGEGWSGGEKKFNIQRRDHHEHTERIHAQRTAMEPTPPDNPASINSASL